MFFASLPHWAAVTGAHVSAQGLVAFTPTGSSPLPEMLDVNFTIHPNQGKSQNNLVKAIGLVITKNLGASISHPLLCLLCEGSCGFWKLLRAAWRRACLMGGTTGSMLPSQPFRFYILGPELKWQREKERDFLMPCPQNQKSKLLFVLCFLHHNKIIKMEGISPPGRVSLGLRTKSLAQKIATTKRHCCSNSILWRILTSIHSCDRGLSNFGGWRSKCGNFHNDRKVPASSPCPR